MILTTILVAASVLASGHKIPVLVGTTDCTDVTASRLIYHLRESIRGSSEFLLVENYPDSVVGLDLVCLRSTSSEAPTVATYSYAISLKNAGKPFDFHVTHGVGVCGQLKVEECADSVVASLDQAVAEAKRTVAASRGNDGGN